MMRRGAYLPETMVPNLVYKKIDFHIHDMDMDMELNACFDVVLERHNMDWWKKCAGGAVKVLMADNPVDLAFIGAGRCEKEHAVLSSLPPDAVKSVVFIDPLLVSVDSSSKKMLVETYAENPDTHATIDIAICLHPYVHWNKCNSYLEGIAAIVKPGGYVLIGAADPEGESGVPDYSSNSHLKYIYCSTIGNWYVYRRT
jgi:hypothetical protein